MAKSLLIKKNKNAAVSSTVIIIISLVPDDTILPGIIACHTNTGCKKQTTDIME